MSPIVVGGFAALPEGQFGSFRDPCVSFAYPAKLKNLVPQALFKVDPRFAPSEVGAHVAKAALSVAGIPLEAVDFVISCSDTPDAASPAAVSFLTARLGLLDVAALDLRQSAAGMVFAIACARALVLQRRARVVLVVCCELLSRYFPERYKATSADVAVTHAVYGDGAAAAVVSAGDEPWVANNRREFFSIEALETVSVPRGADVHCVPMPAADRQPQRMSLEAVLAGEHLPRIQHADLLTNYLELVPPLIARWLLAWGVAVDSLEGFVTHQVCNGLSASCASITGVSPQIVLDPFETHGYIGSAGIGVGLSLLDAVSPPCPGQRVMVMAYGAGVHIGGMLLRRCADG